MATAAAMRNAPKTQTMVIANQVTAGGGAKSTIRETSPAIDIATATNAQIMYSVIVAAKPSLSVRPWPSSSHAFVGCDSSGPVNVSDCTASPDNRIANASR